MENTPQPKKINWGMIILLVVLIPILLLGYKYVSKKMDGTDNPSQTNAPEQSNGFPLAGEWYYKDTGAALKYVNDKYSFTTPQMLNGVLKGQITMTVEWMGSVKTLNYEVISDGKLRISDPENQSPAYEMVYAYDSSSQTLEISDQGYKLTYTKTPSGNVANNNNTNGNISSNSNSGNSGSQNSNQQMASAQQLAGAEWKNTYTENGETWNYTRSFNSPRVENGSITGEKKVGNYCKIETQYKYTMISANQYRWEIVNQTCGGQPHHVQDVGQTGMSNFELSNGGKSLLVYSSGKNPSEGTTWTR
jgi:hypothetical protein